MAQENLYVGMDLGYNNAQMKSSALDYTSDKPAGINAGFIINTTLVKTENLNLDLKTGFYYQFFHFQTYFDFYEDQSGGLYYKTDYLYDVFQNIHIPVTVNLFPFKQTNFYFSSGLYVNYNYDHYISMLPVSYHDPNIYATTLDPERPLIFKTTDFGYIIGAGLRFKTSESAFIAFNYQFHAGITDMNSDPDFNSSKITNVKNILSFSLVRKFKRK